MPASNRSYGPIDLDALERGADPAVYWYEGQIESATVRALIKVAKASTRLSKEVLLRSIPRSSQAEDELIDAVAELGGL